MLSKSWGSVYGLVFPMLRIQMHVARKSSATVTNVAMPYCIFTLMSFTSFFVMNMNLVVSADRMIIALYAVLAMIGFTLMNGGRLPDLPYLTLVCPCCTAHAHTNISACARTYARIDGFLQLDKYRVSCEVIILTVLVQNAFTYYTGPRWLSQFIVIIIFVLIHIAVVIKFFTKKEVSAGQASAEAQLIINSPYEIHPADPDRMLSACKAVVASARAARDRRGWKAGSQALEKEYEKMEHIKSIDDADLTAEVKQEYQRALQKLNNLHPGRLDLPENYAAGQLNLTMCALSASSPSAMTMRSTTVGHTLRRPFFRPSILVAHACWQCVWKSFCLAGLGDGG